MTDTRTSFFTIITSTLNAMETIERCIRSVAAQSFRSYEHIVVDGASSDGTAAFLRSQKELFAVLISEPDTGIYNAWNKALQHARGEWILFLGADDILADAGVLADTATFIGENSISSGIVYGDVMLVSKNTYEDKGIMHLPPEQICTRSYLELRPKLPPHPAVFHHKSILLRSKGFDETYRIAADLKPLFSALCLRKEAARHIPRLINKMTMGGISTSIGMRAFFEDARILRELGIRSSPIAYAWTFTKAAVKACVQKTLGDSAAQRMIDGVRRLKRKPRLWT